MKYFKVHLYRQADLDERLKLNVNGGLVIKTKKSAKKSKI